VSKASDNEFPKVTFAEGAAPGTPAAGLVIAYAKADGLLYSKDDAGAETLVSGGLGGGGGAPTTAQYLVGALDAGLSAEKVKAALYKNYDPDEYPTSGLNAVSNEFDGGSGGAYTWISAPSVSNENSTFAGHLYMELNTDDTTVYRYYRASYAPGATDFTVAGLFEPNADANASAQATQFGLALLDSSDVVIWRALIVQGTSTSDFFRYNDTNLGSSAQLGPMGTPVYLAIQRTSGNVYTGLWSLNGKTWHKGGSSTVATTVAKVAIAGLSGGTVVKYCAVDFVRVFDSITRKIGA
jgi:hypothetical protein